MGPSKELKQIFQIEHNTVKNPNWPEANQFAIYKRDTEKQIQVVSGQSGTRTRDRWIASPTRWPLGYAACLVSSSQRLIEFVLI